MDESGALGQNRDFFPGPTRVDRIRPSVRPDDPDHRCGKSACLEGFCARPIWARRSTTRSWSVKQGFGCRRHVVRRGLQPATTADWNLPAHTDIRLIDPRQNASSGTTAVHGDTPKIRCPQRGGAEPFISHAPVVRWQCRSCAPRQMGQQGPGGNHSRNAPGTPWMDRQPSPLLVRTLVP